MEELFFILLALAPLAFAIAAIVRVGVLKSRFEELSSEVRGLRKRLAKVEGDERVEGPVAQPAAKPFLATPQPVREPEPRLVPPPPPPRSDAPVEEASAPKSAPEFVRPEKQEPPAPKPSIEWERWFGVRGAAIVGGIALAMAGLFFAQYAINHGWFDPAARISTGGLLGALMLILRTRIQRYTTSLIADVVAGAGAVMSYGCAWAALEIHHLIGLELAFAWMAGITAICCATAHFGRRAVVAGFGLVGGFLTPLMLGTWEHSPYTLFGYLIVLNAAFLWMSRGRSWSWIPQVSVVATGLYQALWLFASMDDTQSLLGLGIVLAMGALFVARSLAPGEERTRYASLFLAGMFVLTFGLRANLEVDVLPFAGALLLIVACAAELARRDGYPVIRSIAAGCASAAWIAWAVAVPESEARLVEFALGTFAFAAFWLADAQRGVNDSAIGWIDRKTTPLLLTTFPAVFVLAALTHDAALPITALAAGGVAHLAILAWTVRASGAYLVAAQALMLSTGLGLCAPGAEYGLETAQSVALGIAILAHLAGGKRSSLIACATIVPVLTLASTTPESWPANGAALIPLLVALSAWGAVRIKGAAAGVVAGVAAVVTALASGAAATQLALADMHLGWVLAVLYACAAGLSLGKNQAAGWAIGIATILWLNPVIFFKYPSLDAGQYLPLLALAPAAHAILRRGSLPAEACASALLSFALAETLNVAPVAHGLVLTGLSWMMIGHLRSQVTLKHIGGGLQVTGAAGVLGLIFVPGHFVSSSIPGLGEPALVYGLSAACLAAGSGLAGKLRKRAGSLGIGAALLVFAWICLGVADAFHGGEFIHFQLGQDEAADLAMSISWAIYGVALLCLGTWRKHAGVRWLSLAFTLLAVGKVFLHDLADLEGLYRVASMGGLALTLLLVSLLYQRVVFRKTLTPATA